MIKKIFEELHLTEVTESDKLLHLMKLTFEVNNNFPITKYGMKMKIAGKINYL